MRMLRILTPSVQESKLNMVIISIIAAIITPDWMEAHSKSDWQPEMIRNKAMLLEIPVLDRPRTIL